MIFFCIFLFRKFPQDELFVFVVSLFCRFSFQFSVCLLFDGLFFFGLEYAVAVRCGAVRSVALSAFDSLLVLRSAG